MRLGGNATVKFQIFFQIMKILVLLNLTHPDKINLKSLTLGFTPFKAEQPQQGMELEENKAKKD